MSARLLACACCAVAVAFGCVDPEQFETATDAATDTAPTRDAATQPPADTGMVMADASADDVPSLDDVGDSGAGDGGLVDGAADAEAGDAAPDGPAADMPAPPEPCDVTFEVSFPEATPDGAIHLAGTFHEEEARQWNPGDPELSMERDGASATLTLRIADGRVLEYKYTRGDWPLAEAAADCAEIPNRSARVACGDGGAFAVVDVVAAWSDTCQ